MPGLGPYSKVSLKCFEAYAIKTLSFSLKKLEANLFQTDFLLTWEKSEDQIKQILYVAEALRYFHRHHISSRCFDSGLAVSIFRDKSTRTRFSFSSAANFVGLGVQELDEEKSKAYEIGGG